MAWVWIIIMFLAIIIECVSAQLISIWFALGAIVALIADLLGAAQSVQMILFCIISIIACIIVWPFVKKLIKKNGVIKTNADRYIGKEGIVIEDISNIDAKGQVKVDNQMWTARSENDSIIVVDSKIKVKKIDGVKLIVEEIKE